MLNFRPSLVLQSKIQVNPSILKFQVLLSYIACLMEFFIIILGAENALKCFLCILVAC